MKLHKFITAFLLITLGIATIYCTKKAKTPELRSGELIQSITGAYDSTHSTLIEIYYSNDTFYIYRTSVQRQPTDSMGVWTNTSSIGSWLRITQSKMQLTVSPDNLTRIQIPFNPNDLPFQVSAGSWNYCCECNDRNKCCAAWPIGGNIGYTCIPCPRYSCIGCIAVSTDFGGIRGSQYLFTHVNLTMFNYKIIDL